MCKLTTQQKTEIRMAKKSLETIAETLQEIQDATDGNISATLEEIGISIGFCIGEIDDNLLA